MKSDINDLCEAFLAALTNAGYAVKSIENYKQVSNRFKKFCAENGYDTYTVNIGQIFADNVFNEETGAFVGYRNVMYGRFVRLINSFYLQGTFDFSMVTKEKNLPKSIHLIEIYQDYMEHLKTQYSNIGTIGFFQNGMLHLLRYMEDGGILTLKDLAVSDVVNYICSWSQKHQRNVLCILRNIFRHFGREDLYFAVAGIHPYRTKRIVPMFTDNEIMWLAAGLKRDGEIKPRPYDFRHHFACANIARWAKEKKDVISMLPYLMRYMGHSSLEKTYYYVHLIPDYFADYAAATENLESLLPEVEPYEI